MNYALALCIGLAVLASPVSDAAAEVLDLHAPTTATLLEGEWQGPCSAGPGRLRLRPQNEGEAALGGASSSIVGEFFLIVLQDDPRQRLAVQVFGAVRREELVFDSLTHNIALALRRTQRHLVLDAEYHLLPPWLPDLAGVCELVKQGR